jgi:hypothetical protein
MIEDGRTMLVAEHADEIRAPVVDRLERSGYTARTSCARGCRQSSAGARSIVCM